ncbi:transient receptor potential protein-like isoform X2 [Montipora capricornis]|uniref:transient receptor potential protein-like isoform X2 n=1 Tax=Montipora capricornis TaxID=246305 RepID=UPI0035F1F772
MAEGKDYEAVLTEEDDQNKVHFEGAEEESKQATGRSPEESIELKSTHEGDVDESYGAVLIGEQELLLEIVEEQSYELVKERVTATALMNCGENPLLLAIKVSEKLRERAARNEADKVDFNALAEQVEEFTLRFLDPLKHTDLSTLRIFSVNPELDVILKTATKLEQKKFFEHPVVDSILNERWHTVWGSYWKIQRPGLWLFLKIWCLVDVVLFPLSFSTALVLDWKAPSCLRAMLQHPGQRQTSGFKQLYEHYFTIPYFVFIRDMTSYLALLALHIAICLESSQLRVSDLEWAILVFLCGRLLVETKQIADIARSEDKKMRLKELKTYLRDRWNLFDLVILCMFFCGILPLRIVTWASSESASNNQVLEIAGYLYGFNTMLLTVRAFGSLLEAFEGVGTIQIALFQVIRDAVVIVVHFVVITVAFSSAITKVFRASPGIQQDTEKYSWLGITSQLGLSLLDLSEGLDYFRSADSSSETLAHLLFAAYLVMALLLLVNMLIALLSNTYQKVQDNSRREWAFQKAVTIQTYRNYHPIPVPFNIISMFLMLFPCLRMKKTREMPLMKDDDWKTLLHNRVSVLQSSYRRRYGDSFPLTEPLHHMVEETNNTESMVNQILHKTFTSDKALLPTGPEAWEAHNSILVEGCLLTCRSYTPVESDYGYISCFGAKYRTNFSPRFPHFEMMILESVDTSSLSFGVVPESWDCKDTPGQKGTVGFHTDLKIFDFDYQPVCKQEEVKRESKPWTKRVAGVARIRRGDVIRCTVMFEHEEERHGKFHVPVRFTVNGTRIQRQGFKDSPSPQRFIKSKPDDPLYPFIGFSYKSSVLAKMCARDDVDDYQDLQLQEVKSELTEAKGELSEVKLQLNDVKVKLREATSKLDDVGRLLEEKLDAVLTKAGVLKNE